MCIYEHCSWLKEANILKKQNRYHEKVEQLLIRDHMDQYVLVINRRTSHQLCNHTLQLWPNHVEEGGARTVYVGRMLHNTVGGALTAALHHHSARSPVIHLTQTHTSVSLPVFLPQPTEKDRRRERKREREIDGQSFSSLSVIEKDAFL